jgi:hypothetical protein
MTPVALRIVALLIAVAAVIDPAITTTRRIKPEIAVFAADRSTDHALADRIAGELGGSFNVIRAPFNAAAAMVIAGSPLTLRPADLTGPVFAVTHEPPALEIHRVDAPTRVHLNDRVPVTVHVRTRAGAGTRLEVSLNAAEVVVDRVQRTTAAAIDSLVAPLSFVPTSVGAVPLRVVVTRNGDQPAEADLLLDVSDERWAVLFYDGRPSWLSTFVRRALERDPRFDIDSRVITSRNISTDAGQPPIALNDPAELSAFDVIVVGAPELLDERAVHGLETFLRRRGGSAVFLLDHQADGPYQQLTGVRQWSTATVPASVPLAYLDERVRGSSLLWPATLPAGAEPVALDSLQRPIVWRTSVGVGSLFVSGALDAWRFRADTAARFDRFWQLLLAHTADAAPAPVEINLADALLQPGEDTDVIVTLRDAALADASPRQSIRASVAAVIEGGGNPVNLRLWADGSVGRFRAVLRAPQQPGAYRLVVSSIGARAATPFVVAPTVRRATNDRVGLIQAWTASRGGSVVAAAQLDDLQDAIARTIEVRTRRQTWYPMRSAWWIIPFALLLSAEWWLRRRRGQR